MEFPTPRLLEEIRVLIGYYANKNSKLVTGKTLAKLKYGVEHALEQCNEGRHLVQQSKACSKNTHSLRCYNAPQVRVYFEHFEVQDSFLHGTVHFLKRSNNFTFVTPPLSL